MNLKPSPPQVVAASEADLPSIARLAGIIWRAHYSGIISIEQIEYMLGKMYSLEMMLEEIRLRGVHYERLIVGEEFTGFASYGPAERKGVFKLRKIYLHPAWQRRGLGSFLLQHCERKCFQLGANRLILTVNKRNSKAIEAYRRNGFTITESVVVDIGGGFLMDDYVMTKEIMVQSA